MLTVTETSENGSKSRREVLKVNQEFSFLDVRAKYRNSIKKMLAFFPQMWSGKLGSANEVKHHIGLKKNTSPFFFAFYQSGPKTRKRKE